MSLLPDFFRLAKKNVFYIHFSSAVCNGKTVSAPGNSCATAVAAAGSTATAATAQATLNPYLQVE